MAVTETKVTETFVNGQKDLFVRQDVPLEVRRKNVLDSWVRIKNSHSIPKSEIVLTEERIERAFDQYEHGLSHGEPARKAAFLIQSRSSLEFPYGDITGFLPALSTEKYGINPEVRHKIFFGLPPFEVTQYLKKDNSGDEKIIGSIISVPLSIDDMRNVQRCEVSQMKKMRAVVGYTQPLIVDAVRFAKEKLGVDSFGLGETMASMTAYGRIVEAEVPDSMVGTGHAGTTYLINSTITSAAEQGGIDLGKVLVGIIGCGSIGSAVSLNLDPRVNQIMLSDIDKVRAENLKNEITSKRPEVEVVIAESNEELAQKSRLIVGAGSNLTPILTRRDIVPGTIIVDDSQPPRH